MPERGNAMNEVKDLALELLKDDNCQIAVRKAGSYRFRSSYRYEAHKHIEYEINYISSGKCVMTFDEEYVPLKDGECVIISPFHKHGFLVDAKRGCELKQAEMSIQIPAHMEKLFPFSRGDHPYCKIKDCEDVVPLIEQIARIYRSERENEYKDTLLDFAVVQLLVALGYHTGKQENISVGIKNKKILEIMKYIQEHYNEQIKIERLAKEYDISSRYVRKYFSEVIGMSCSDYITLMRINKAKEMLWETKKNITVIAMEMGYGTPQYFCRVFKNEVGISPSEYRSKWKEKKQYL